MCISICFISIGAAAALRLDCEPAGARYDDYYDYQYYYVYHYC